MSDGITSLPVIKEGVDYGQIKNVYFPIKN